MARRIPEEELERLKREIDLVALVQSKGIELKKHGSKDLVGLSPFSDEKTPSFIVTPDNNLWHCMSSGKGGTVIDFVMHTEGVSFRHAYELLSSGDLKNVISAKTGPKVSTVPKLPPPVAFDADDQTVLKQVLDYYHERLKQSPNALEYLASRGLNDPEMLRFFRIGFADRTLGLRLPHKNRQEGAEIRERLKRLGLLRSNTGHEHFNGCVVFPVDDGQGRVTEIYGRKIVQRQSTGLYHLYLPGPHQGIFNPLCLKSRDIILTESVIDALTFWVNGMRHVTCIWGTEGFSDDLAEALVAAKTRSVYLAYDNDPAGNRAAERDAERLQSLGIECYRVKFPPKMDANEYALEVTPANKSLSLLVKSAQWIGKGKAPSKTEESLSKDDTPAPSSLDALAANVSSQAEVETVEAAKDTGLAAKEKKVDCEAREQGEDILIDLGERQYRVRGLQKNTSFEVLKVNLRLMCDDLFFVNVLDLYHAKQRNVFIAEAAVETNLKPQLIKRDLGKVLLKLEELQEARIAAALQPQDEAVIVAEDEQKQALEFLKAPKLIERLLADFEKCGIVGEDGNKVTAWLACVSRTLRTPLAVIIQSTSAAGKSTLMEAVLSFFPEEEQVKYSAMTGQSLYYLGESNLKHKILAIVEEEGAERASYALKLLQSEGELTIASTGKDPDTGRMKTEEYHVEGPVMIFLTTTAIDIDEELMNRCLVLTVDEGPEQTRRIHARQRQARTLSGLIASEERISILKLQKNIQRILKPYRIVNDYAESLTFASHRTRARRDHEKYLTLIDAVTLTHQHQRKIEKQIVGGKTVEFIRTTLEDIEIANQLAPEVLGRSLDELPPQTRRLLGILQTMVDDACEKRDIQRDDCPFNRRQVREFTGWSNTQIKVHLDRLEDMEYIERHRGGFGQAYLYALLYDGSDESKAQVIGLIDTKKLRASNAYDANLTGSEPDLAGQNGDLAATSPNGKTPTILVKTESEENLTGSPDHAQETEKEEPVIVS